MKRLARYKRRFMTTRNPKNKALRMRQLKKDLPGFIILAILFIILCIVGWILYLKIGKPLYEILLQPDAARRWILSHGAWSYVLFVMMVFLQVVVAIIPGEPFQIAAGLAFGPVLGTILCMLGVLCGSIVTFMLTRIFGYKLLELLFSKRTLDKFDLRDYDPETIERVVFIAFIIPGTPKDFLSYAVGLTPLSLKSWIIITFIARLPSIAMASIGGHAMSGGNFVAALVFIVMGMVISTVMYLIYQWIHVRRLRRQ